MFKVKGTGPGVFKAKCTAVSLLPRRLLSPSARCASPLPLLRSQGAAEVVMYDPREELVLVLAMDFDGRATRIIGPLHGAKYGKYHTDFIPYVNSRTEIYNSDDVGSVFKTNDEAVTFRVPQPSVEAY